MLAVYGLATYFGAAWSSQIRPHQNRKNQFSAAKTS